MLAKICEFLEPFKHVTLSTEGHSHTIERNLPTFDFLLDHYESAKILYEDNTFMQSCIETGWQKLNKYYVQSETSPVYVAALVLDPTWKWTYCDHHWRTHPHWITKAKAEVYMLWIDYKPRI